MSTCCYADGQVTGSMHGFLLLTCDCGHGQSQLSSFTDQSLSLGESTNILHSNDLHSPGLLTTGSNSLYEGLLVHWL